jgi:hypothetical protein
MQNKKGKETGNKSVSANFETTEEHMWLFGFRRDVLERLAEPIHRLGIASQSIEASSDVADDRGVLAESGCVDTTSLAHLKEENSKENPLQWTKNKKKKWRISRS